MSHTKNLLHLLLLAFFLKGIVTSVIVPLWEFPDEQAHFAQVSYYNETGLTFQSNNDLSQELFESERVMGTLRNERGENFYTYKPQNKLEFSDTITGPEENFLNQLDHNSRHTYVKKEAARYPPLFYLISSVGYQLAYPHDIFIRVFFTRLVSIVLGALTVFVTFHIGQQLFKNPLHSVTLASLIAFHPMFSFLSSGVNNDNLINLIGAIITFQILLLINQGLTQKTSLLVGLTLGLGVLTKPLIFPLLPAAGLAIFYEWFVSKRNLRSQLNLLLPLIVMALIAGGWFFLLPILQGKSIPYLPKVSANSPRVDLTLFSYLLPQLSKYYRETLVWYWGVFKWLGVILPINLIRLIKILMGLSALGIFKAILSKTKSISLKHLYILALISLAYAITLTLWDYQLVRSIGFSHGIQGRNFFPTIAAHMALLLIGLLALIPDKLKLIVSKLLILFFIAINTISLYTLANAYYHLQPFSTFLLELSQYKPIFLKYPFSIFWFGIYILSLLVFLSKLFLFKSPNNR